VRIINETRSACLADNVILADTFFTRLRGLLGRPVLEPGWCLVLKPCRSVHTMFMNFSIDVMFVDKNGRVVSLAGDMKPFRFSPVVPDSRLVVELPAGTLARTGTAPGDAIIFSKG
jgi:hypothetical protein